MQSFNTAAFQTTYQHTKMHADSPSGIVWHSNNKRERKYIIVLTPFSAHINFNAFPSDIDEEIYNPHHKPTWHKSMQLVLYSSINDDYYFHSMHTLIASKQMHL